MTTKSIEGAMPPLPEPAGFRAPYPDGNLSWRWVWTNKNSMDRSEPVFTADQMHAYAAPLLARVEGLETLLFVWSDEQALESPENRKLFRAAVRAALAAHKEQP